ncbi:CBO0543 family protein [Pelosinus propionicus]|uniref:Uncharacterized protein n=1 Tax=Pelosinus propionicus DSM 13327 TaxID=1123291 RepID=A0A1I4P9X8_9FIRM|nr:CBO0543 family protein [Pelosinus propionicus]SFM24674.1 hypothetical protein SAMN04490355_106020 [Pelosinus propionicus DSM 13327]
MIYFIRFAIAWLCWLIFADKKRWREIMPVCVLSITLAFSSDLTIVYHSLWKYTGEHPLPIAFLDAFGIYSVVTYLFIQWLPKEKTTLRLIHYWFAWSLLSITLEWLHVHMGHMHYGLWWHMGWSYLADWIIFTLLYFFHRELHLWKLRRDE